MRSSLLYELFRSSHIVCFELLSGRLDYGEYNWLRQYLYFWHSYRPLNMSEIISKTVLFLRYEFQEVIDVACPLRRKEGRDLSEVTPSSRFSFSNFSFKVCTSLTFQTCGFLVFLILQAMCYMGFFWIICSMFMLQNLSQLASINYDLLQTAVKDVTSPQGRQS